MAKGPTVSTTFNAIDKVSKPMKKIQAGIGKFAAIAGAAFVTGGIARGIQSFVTEASKIEDAVAGFTPLLGGVEKANELVDMLNKTAATTPFQFENISAAAKQLLPVMNQDIERTTETFRMLGDTAGGNAQKLESITRGFTKAMLKNKVDMESLNMIAEAGVPIYSELAASLGVSVEEMMKMSSAGEIAATDLEDAFRRMTSEGGIFFNGMEIASQTFSGKMSTLKDNIALTQAAIGKALLPTLKPMVDRLIEVASAMREWMEENQELIQQNVEKTIKGISKAVSIFVKLWNGGFIQALIAGIAAFKIITKAIWVYQNRMKIAAAAQAVFNAIAAANPFGLIVLGFAAVTAAVVLLIKNWDKVKAVMSSLWEGMKEFGSWLGSGFLSIWDAIMDKLLKFWNLITKVKEAVKGAISKVGDFFQGGGITGESSNPYERRGLVGRNDGTINRTTTNNSTLDVNFNNAPAGTSYRQRGRAPGIQLNTGFGGGGL